MRRIGQQFLIFFAIIAMGIGTLHAEQITITGRVTDNNGEALIGVSINVKNGKHIIRGTVSDFDGNFSLSAPVGSTLELSYIGYKTESKIVTSDMSNIVITLDETHKWHRGNLSNYLRQSRLFYQVEAYSNYVYLNLLFSVGGILLNTKVPDLFLAGMTYDYMSLKDNGQKIMDTPKYASFKLKDMISWINVGGKLGWSGGVNSCFGIYGRFYFEHRRRRLALQHDSDFEYYWSNAIKPGVGIRFSPQFSESGVNPYLELGTTYTHIVGCKTPYGKDKDQFGHGMTYSFGLGVTGIDFNGNNNSTIFVTLELPRYDFLNKNWSNDGGYYFPYANIKDTQFRISVNYSLNF